MEYRMGLVMLVRNDGFFLFLISMGIRLLIGFVDVLFCDS